MQFAFETKAGELWAFSPSGHSRFKYGPTGAFHILMQTIDPALCLGLLDESDLLERPGIRQLLFEPYGESCLFVADIGMEIGRLIARIQDNPYRDSFRRLYLEGAMLELAALALGAILPARLERHDRTRIDRRDIGRMRDARDILDEQYRDPPTETQLAGRLGISVAKLKRDFKKVQGRGVRGYVIERRLAEADRLLREGSVSGKEAAYLVGYRSHSHFTQAFKRYFGRLPSAV